MATGQEPQRRRVTIPGDLRVAGSIGPRIPVSNTVTFTQAATSGSIQNVQKVWSTIGPNQGVLVEYYSETFIITVDVTGSLSLQAAALIIQAQTSGAPVSFNFPAFNLLISPAPKVANANTLMYGITPYFLSYDDFCRTLGLASGGPMTITPLTQIAVFNTSAGGIQAQSSFTFIARVVSEVEEVT